MSVSIRWAGHPWVPPVLGSPISAGKGGAQCGPAVCPRASLLLQAAALPCATRRDSLQQQRGGSGGDGRQTPGSSHPITFRADLRRSSGPNASPHPGNGFMRRPPGPIESYCLIKNKFLGNLFFVFYYFFLFFVLHKTSSHTKGEGEARERGGSGDLQQRPRGWPRPPGP